MPRASNRDVSRPVQMIRNFLLGRKSTTSLRNADNMSPKTQPQPCLPYGPHAKYANNHYCEHDARREVKRPVVIKPGKTSAKLCFKPQCYKADCVEVPCPPPKPQVSVCNPCAPRPECSKKDNNPPCGDD